MEKFKNTIKNLNEDNTFDLMDKTIKDLKKLLKSNYFKYDKKMTHNIRALMLYLEDEAYVPSGEKNISHPTTHKDMVFKN